MHKKKFYSEKKKMKQSKTGILMIRGISNIFEQRKGYYKPVWVDNFRAEIKLSMKATEIEVKHWRIF